MREPEIQPSAPLQSRVFYIVFLLLFRKRVPNSILLLVPPDVIRLSTQEEHDSQEVDNE